MDNTVVEQIVQSLSFEVEAVPKNKSVEITSPSKNTPLNVKIRVRKKEDLTMRRGVISIPKFDDEIKVPQKIRLVNSDQTIMSFDVFMEAEIEKKRKPSKHIFHMLKPGMCLGASDEDDYPYLPSSSYSANITEGGPNSRSDGVLKQNFTLSKNTYDEYGDRGAKTFLGKCKPGGCLDPPFGEDKYSYKPYIQDSIINEQNNLKKESHSGAKCKKRHSSVFHIGIFKKKRKTSDKSTDTKESAIIKVHQSNSILNLYQVESTVNSLSTTQSNSIITYPPGLPCTELPLNCDKNVKSRVCSEEKTRKSSNEVPDSYFMPPKGRNKDKDKNIQDNSEINLEDESKRKAFDTSKVPISTPIQDPIPIPIPIKSVNVKKDVFKAGTEDLSVSLNSTKLSDSSKNRLSPSKDYIENEPLPNRVDERAEKMENKAKIVENKYNTTDVFDKNKLVRLSDTDSSVVTINSQKSGKRKQQQPVKVPPRKESHKAFNQMLKKYEISQEAPLEQDNFGSMKTIINTQNYKNSDFQNKISLPLDNSVNTVDTDIHTEKSDQTIINIPQNNTHTIDLESCQDTNSVKLAGLSEPVPENVQCLDANMDASNIKKNTDSILLHADIEEDISEKSDFSKKTPVASETGDDLTKHNYASDDYENKNIYGDSEMRGSTNDSDTMILQLKSSKDTANTELSTNETITNSEAKSSKILLNTDIDFKILESVDEDINLVGEHEGDTGKVYYDYENEIAWKSALRTTDKDFAGTYNSSVTTSLIDKGTISPNKRIVVPVFNTATISKDSGTDTKIPNEFEKISNVSKSNVGNVSVSSSIPSTGTLKSVLRKETVIVDLGFHSYVNEKDERVLKTFDTLNEPTRYFNDSITLVKSQIRLSANEIRVPVDAENDMFINIKKATVNQNVSIISKSELETERKGEIKTPDTKCRDDIMDREFLHGTLVEIYDQELVPLQIIIKNLKDEIDILATQQMALKDKIYSPKKPARVIYTNRRCGCLKKI